MDETTAIVDGADPVAPKSAKTPMDRAAAYRLMDHWRDVGIWLSVWSDAGEPIWHDRRGPRLWPTLFHRAPQVQRRMKRCVEACLKGETTDTPDPWGRGLGMTVIPILKRRRRIGAIVAGWVRGEPDEDLIRFCGQAGLDATLIAGMMVETTIHRDETFDGWQRLLTAMIGQVTELEGASRQIESFTRNLDATYEELNLVYGVTSMLAVEDDSDRLLRSVTQEVLTVCKAASVVLLLPRPAISFKRHATEARTDVLRSGRATADDDELIKLAGVIGVTPERVHPDKMEKHAIHNDVRNTPDLAWISGWMDHVVGLPLVCDGRWLGAMLAINRTVDEDFSSVEVKFLRAVADRITTFLESQRLYDDLADLFMGMLHALVSSIDAKDPYTCGHSTRVAVIGRRIAQQAGMSPAECQRVYLSGLLHDVGKIGVPDDILCKPGRLTNEEFDKLRGHPEIGAKILGHIRQVEDLIPGVLYHHERFDGRGYPRKLAGDNIPVLGRILCVADGFDAMTSTRTYRAALPVKVALAEVRRCAGTQFDPYFAELFLQNDADELLALAHERSGTQLGGGVATGIADPWEAAVQAFGEESLGAIIKSWQRLARSAPA